MLQSMGSQKVGHDLMTKQKQQLDICRGVGLLDHTVILFLVF